MKGAGLAMAPPKRRWRTLAIGVLFLVVLSMLVPLGFLLGLHNGFHSPGFVPLHRSPPSNGLRDFDRLATASSGNHSKGDHSSHLDELVRRLGPTIPKDALGDFGNNAKNKTNIMDAAKDGQSKGVTASPQVVLPPPRDKSHVGVEVRAGAAEHVKVVDEIGKLCELRYGSYCLWRKENREEMKDSMIKKLKDQLFVARAYFPSIAKIPAQNKLSREMKQNIQDLERILSESTTDADLPIQIEKKSQKMESVISRAKSVILECNNVDRKLRQILDMTEDEANFHMRQSAFLYQLAVQTMPKSLHCLSMRLTVEYFQGQSYDKDCEKYTDQTLHHYVILSSNVLAASVVINSTVVHARDSANLVFHVLTDGKNYYAMKVWFFKNAYKDATIEVLNIEHFKFGQPDKATLSPLSLPLEFRVFFHGSEDAQLPQNGTQYISTFSHSHYLLPEIFKSLGKVVVLDDDIVVQQDLSPLWSLDIGGKVNGAAQFCAVRFSQLQSLLGENSYHKDLCCWMSGLNIIDLARWRELQLTEAYWKLWQEQRLSMEDGSALRASLLTFQDLIYALDQRWIYSGLGHDYELDVQGIKTAAVLHYNGKMKPWLDLGIPKYKAYWRKFLNREDQFLGQCNVNP